MKKRNKHLALDMRYLRLIIIGLLLIGASLACNLPGDESSGDTNGEVLDEAGIETVVARTIAAKTAEDQ